MDAYINLLRAISIYFDMFALVSDKLKEDIESEDGKEVLMELKNTAEEFNGYIYELLSSQKIS